MGPLTLPVLSRRITNICTNVNVNPTSTAGVTAGGDVAAILSVADDSAELSKIGLSGNAFKLDNTAGVAAATAVVSGTTPNVKVWTAGAYLRRSGAPVVNLELSAAASSRQATASYEWITSVGSAVVGSAVLIRVQPGGVAFFVLNTLAEGSGIPPIRVNGAPVTVFR